MICSNRFNITCAKEYCILGEYTRAKEIIQDRCKTIPEKQARRLGQLVGALMDSGYADQAAAILNEFYKD